MSDAKVEKSSTKRLVVIGDPISHSLSPVIQGAALKETGLDSEFEYEKVQVKLDELGAFVELVKNREIYGANVTLPHKVAIISFLDKLTKEAELIGAVNTLYYEDRKLIGHNTDGIGCLNTLKENDVDVTGKKVLLLGAGGAARAIAFVLALNNVKSIVILDMKIESAKSLAEEITEKTGIYTVPDDSVHVRDYLDSVDVLIHCTPVGMKGENENSTLLRVDDFSKKIVVMDIVYNPQKTLLLKEAEKAGCKIVEGLGMLVHQGAVGFEIWTGKKAPIDIMRKAMIEALGN